MDYPTSNDDTCNNRNEGGVSKPGLPLLDDKKRKNGGKEGSGGANGLIKRHRKVPQRHVPTNDGEAENDTEPRDLRKLYLGLHGLQRNHLHQGYGDVAEQRTGCHVAEGEENRVLEAVVCKQVLVEEKNADVGAVPCDDHADRRPWDRRSRGLLSHRLSELQREREN